MFLEKIEIQGFKSFAEAVTLVFNKTLTAIVGPNGSGKSNIADAIRWVLGEQSLKLLRGKKSEDVIFAGSDKKGRLGFARVALYLNNQGRQAGIDYDQVVLERAIHRSGDIEYLINGTNVRLTDIQLLLAKAQIAQKSYGVIGQGMIDTLLMLPAQERRDFFDEATGVKQYQLKKHQALLKLEHTEENLGQAELVLQELTPRLRTLSRQVNRLARKEELEKELQQLQSDYYSFLATDINGHLTTLRAKKQKEDERIQELTRRQQGVQQKLDSVSHDRGRDERFSELQATLYNLQQEYNRLTKKKIVLEGQQDLELIKKGSGNIVLLKQRLERISGRLNTLTARVKEFSHAIERGTAAIKLLDRQVTEAKQRLTTVEKHLADVSVALDWNRITSDARMFSTEHESLMLRLEELTTLEELSNIKNMMRRFAEKLKTFLYMLSQRSATDQQDLWNTFKRLSGEYEALMKKIHDEKTMLDRKLHELEYSNQQRGELLREQEDLERELQGDRSMKEKARTATLVDIARDLEAVEQNIRRTQNDIDSFNQTEEHKKQNLLTLQEEFRTLQYDLTVKNNELTQLKVELAKYETRKEDLDRETAVEAPNVLLRELRFLNTAETRERIENVKRQLAVIGGIDEETVSEYRSVSEKHSFLKQQTTDLRKAHDSLTVLISDLDQHITKQFQSSFKAINALFSKYFKKLFNGGHAKLMLQVQTLEEPDSEAAEDGGSEAQLKPAAQKRIGSLDYTVDFQASPPGKKLASITMLSGGEKALTAISLVCAVIANNPPPFVVLDEVDAALDEANSIRFAEIINELAHKTQFITITHNRATMHEAKILYGVTMGDDGVSRLLSVSFEEADKISPTQ